MPYYLFYVIKYSFENIEHISTLYASHLSMHLNTRSFQAHNSVVEIDFLEENTLSMLFFNLV
jgi:hypothetical protein